MTNSSTKPMSLAEFAELVDTFGADRTRWPLLRRHRADALIALDADARRLLDEAAALDTVLDQATIPEPSNLDGLLDKVMARATAGPRLATSTPSAAANQTRVTATRPRVSTADRRDAWRAGALMAASLVAGLYLGQAQIGATAIPVMQELAATTFGTGSQGFAFATLTTDALDDE